jgi:hypothetical protein
MADDSTNQQPGAMQSTRSSDFSSIYANNVFFEASAWDLKIIFGELDQSSGTASIQQRAAVTVPWPQAKLMSFWLRVQVELAEATVKAKIPIRPDLLQQSDSSAIEFHEIYQRIRADFLASL